MSNSGAISAQLVKELRERTGAGMMECKKALVEVGGDLEKAVEHMRKTGLAKADKKADRVAAEGVLAVSQSDNFKQATLLEANSETDFVAMGEDFGAFAQKSADLARAEGINDVNALGVLGYEDGSTVDEKRRALIAKIGENITLRRFITINSESGVVGAYLHGRKIGVLVEIDTNDIDLAKDLAMHVAASNPKAVDRDGLSEEFIAKEREIYLAKAQSSGKSADIVEKMVEGSLRKLYEEVTLLGQKFVKNPDISVSQLLKEKKAKVLQFVRFEVGEGIEKTQSDFVAEVMAQAQGK